MNVAQLKPLFLCFVHRLVSCFHVRMNVAQLKRRIAVSQCHKIGEFPRSNERGSIEARRLEAKTRASRKFPRSNERGSIEAIVPKLRAKLPKRVSTFE